jgi:membrane-bound lytic murein transglycosylase F
MNWKKSILVGAFILLLAACGEQALPLPFKRPLPFPTPSQHDLIVLITSGPLTVTTDESGNMVGLAHDLASAFAQELNVGVKFLIVAPDQIDRQLAEGKAHFAATWRSPPADGQMKVTPPIAQTRDLLIQHEASLPLIELADLDGKTVHVVAGTRQAQTMRRLATEIPDLRIVEDSGRDIINLIEAVENRQIDLTVIDSELENMATQFAPSIQSTLQVGGEQPVVWALGEHPNAELEARLGAFVERVQRDGTLARLEDRYFGHVRRLKQADVRKFLAEIERTLPKLRKHFQLAEGASGIDWRLIAAVAYHESHWDPNATSPTGVRGIMMLTEETADRLGVGNRLDARESILAGARYVNILRALQPDEVGEPDRTWLALAAYNIGPGHFNAARTLAKQLGVDPGAWYEMKQVLPLLAQPKYYQRLKSGRARGGEAVLLVENIRSYYEILRRNEAPHVAVSATVEAMVGMGGAAPGLKPGR